MHEHLWAASFLSLGFLGSRCECGARTFLGGYGDRRDAIVERLNRSWRVR